MLTALLIAAFWFRDSDLGLIACVIGIVYVNS